MTATLPFVKFVTLTLAVLGLISCKERRISPESDGSDNPMSSLGEDVGPEGSKDPVAEEELRRLAQEQASSEQKVADLQKLLDDLQSKMTSGNLTEADKLAYQKQLDQIVKDKEAAEAQRKAVEEEMRKATAARKRYRLVYDKPDPNVDDCLVFEGDPMLDGAQLRVLPCNANSPNQLFMIDNLNETTLRFISSLSSKCVSVINDSKDADAQLVQKPCGTIPGQTFRMITKATNEYYFQNTGSSLCLKIMGDGHVHQNNCQTNASPFHINLIEVP